MNTKILIKVISLFLTFIFSAPITAYTLQDDPSSSWGGDSLTKTLFTGNVVTYQNLVAQNWTSNAIPSLSLAVPFAWPQVDNMFAMSTLFWPMQWRNDLNGWYTNDLHYDAGFNYTVHTSLLITLTNPAVSSIAMGEIADMTGNQPLPLTEPCNSPPSCTSAPFPLETRNMTDLIPLISLGAFAPHETKRFDLSFTYAFGDQRVGAYATQFIGNTVSNAPLPSALWLFSSALGALCILKKRNIA